MSVQILFHLTIDLPYYRTVLYPQSNQPVKQCPMVSNQSASATELRLSVIWERFRRITDTLPVTGTKAIFSISDEHAGHQFGAYNPDLGDGRGLLLAQVVAKSGETFDLSPAVVGEMHRIRACGDGRAVIRRLCARAFVQKPAGLNIPTTRALHRWPVTRRFTERSKNGVHYWCFWITYPFWSFEHLFTQISWLL